MHTILVADDSVTLQKAVQIVFDKEPFTVVVAQSAAEALERAKATQPHVILTDHTLSDRSGYELAAALKADPATASAHVLLLSSTAQPYDEGRGSAAGAAGTIIKPFDCQSLLDKVRGLLGVPATPPGTFVPSAAARPALAGVPSPPSGLPGLPRPPQSGATVGGAAAAGLPRPPAFGAASSPPLAAPAIPSRPVAPMAPDPFAAASPGSPFAQSVPPAVASSVPPSPSSSPFGQSPAASPFGQSPASSPFGASPVSPAAPAAPAAATPSFAPATPAYAPAAAPPPAQNAWSAPVAARPPPPAAAPAPLASSSALSSQTSLSSLAPTPAQGQEPWQTARSVDLGAAAAAARPAPSFDAGLDSEFLEVSDEELIGEPSLPPSVVSPSTPSALAPSAPSAAPSADLAKETLRLDPNRVVAAADAAARDDEDDPFGDDRGAVTQKVDRQKLVELDQAAERARQTGLSAAVAQAVAASPVVQTAVAQATLSSDAAPSPQALSAEAREIIERVVWEIVPELAEVILREEIQKLLQAKGV